MKTKSASKKIETKKSAKPAVKKASGGFDYNALKDSANEHEREGRWAEAAQAWTTIAEQSTNPMVIKMARGRAEAAKATARDNDESVATSAPLEETLAQNATGVANEASWERALPEPGYTPPAGKDEDDGEENEPATPDRKPRDARLPEVGTVIQKRDRKGELRSECKVVEGGIEYKGTTYKSLSSAALAASKDLGLGASTLDGWAWWGLKKRDAQPGATKRNVVESLERAFAKYRERADAIVKGASGDDLAKVAGAIRAQGAALLAMAPEAAPEA